jgi:hypothetical protein
MVKESVVDLDAFRAQRAEETLRSDILKFATGPRFKDEIVAAAGIYKGDATGAGLLMEQDPLENMRFLDWFISEHKHSTENKRIIDMFAELRGKNLDEGQQKLLDEWKASHLGAFEVASTEGGVLTLNALFGEESHSVNDPSACDEVEPGMILIVRITSSWGQTKLGGAPVVLPAEAKQKLIDAVNADFEGYKKEHADAELSAFLAENTRLLISRALELA